ncbi:LamG-like jellyroll fold domain-containing protein [Desulfonatronovibrio magnus]|uniref:LamG-like jellyroll fold domain-containing protein n=1 Tax=Desulfonatronovibrio magnus TaxID=698827 RepID=UPI0018DE8781|nr:LamG-like jellyroll fold domain-containing protein [Desulfonatronovibrio magnus]
MSSDSGSVIGHPRIIISAAHSIHNPGSIHWDTPTWKIDGELQQLIRDYRVYTDYASLIEQHCDVNSYPLECDSNVPLTRDFLAGRVYKDANNGLFGDWYTDGNNALKSNAEKLALGYPNYGSLHEIGPFTRKFYTQLDDYLRVWFATAEHGMSGGPVWVKNDHGEWVFAGIIVAKHKHDLWFGVKAITEDDWLLVNQLIPDNISISPENKDFPNAGGTGEIQVTSNISWKATSLTPSFVTIDEGTEGEGNGTIRYSVEPGQGLQRTGLINVESTVSGYWESHLFVINQKATPGIFITHPEAGSIFDVGETVPLRWENRGDVGDKVNIDLSTDGGLNWSSIENNYSNTGTYNWTGAEPACNNCMLRVQDTTYPFYSDQSKPFTISSYCAEYDFQVDSVRADRTSMSFTQSNRIRGNVVNKGPGSDQADVTFTITGPGSYICKKSDSTGYNSSNFSEQMEFSWPQGCPSLSVEGTYTATIHAMSVNGCDNTPHNNSQSVNIYVSPSGSPPTIIGYEFITNILDSDNYEVTSYGKTFRLESINTSTGRATLRVDGVLGNYDSHKSYHSNDNKHIWWFSDYGNIPNPFIYLNVGYSDESSLFDSFEKTAYKGDIVDFNSEKNYNNREVYHASIGNRASFSTNIAPQGSFSKSNNTLLVDTSEMTSGSHEFAIVTDSYASSTEYLTFGRIRVIDRSYTLNINKGNEGEGGVLVNGATCILPCTQNFYKGSTVTVEALPGEGYVFFKWGGLTDDISVTNPLSIDMNDNLSFSVFFTPIKYYVMYHGNEQHSGTPPTDAKSYRAGDVIKVLDNIGNLAKHGYIFAGWNTKPGGDGITKPVDSTFSMPEKDVHLYAKWEATISRNLAVNSTGASSVSITATPSNYGGTTNYSHTIIPNNTEITLTAPDAKDNAIFTSWTGCDETDPETRTCTVTMDEDKTVTVNYTSVTETVATPTFDPDGGAHEGNIVHVTISCSTPGATIHYTTDGSEPTQSSWDITSGSFISVPVPGTLKARAYKEGMNPSEIKTAHYHELSNNLISGLVSYWTLDNHLLDSHGTNHCEAASGVTTLSDQGIINYCPYFNGSSSAYLTCGNDSSLNITGTAITMSAWIFSNNPNSHKNIISKGRDYTSNYGYHLRWVGDGRVDALYRLSNGQSNRVLTPVLENDRWYHIASTFDGATAKIYVDGELVGSNVLSGSIGNANTVFTIGAHSAGPSGWGYQWRGKIDEVGIWERVLSDLEVSLLYNSGQGNQYPFSATSGHTLTVSSIGATSVSITANPEAYSGITEYIYTGIDSGTEIVLTAPATSGGADFTSWTGCDLTDAARRSCSITMTSDKKATVHYGTVSLENNSFIISDKSGSYNIWTADFDGDFVTPKNQLTHLDAPYHVDNFKVHEQTQRIVYSYYETGKRIRGLRVIDFAGNMVQEITNLPSGGGASDHFDISPNGKEIIFAKGLEDIGLNRQEAWIIGIDNSNLRKIIGSHAVRNRATHKSSFIWLDNDIVVFSNTEVWSAYAARHEIHLYNLVTEEFAAWPGNSPSTSIGDRNPVLNPDRNKVALEVCTQTQSGINIVDWPNGLNSQELISLRTPRPIPLSWTDNEHIVFTDRENIFLINIDGNNKINLTRNLSENVSRFYLLRSQNIQPPELRRAERIFDTIESLYPQWFYPSGLPVEVFDEYEHTMYYRYYASNNITLLTYNGVVYYEYMGRYHNWGTVDDWLTYLDYCGLTVSPASSGTTSFGDIIHAAGNISWLRLWTGSEALGSYVNTSAFNAYGHGWISVDDLDSLKMDFAQHENTTLYVLPWSGNNACGWKKHDVDFQSSDLVIDSVNLDIDRDTYASEVFKVENVQNGNHWLQLWIGGYLDTSSFNIYGNGWIEASDLSRLVIPGDAFSGGDSLWIRQYSQSPGSSSWVDYDWLELKE